MAVGVQTLLKLLAAVIILVFSAKVAQHSKWLGALIISLPVTSILSLMWFHSENTDLSKLADYSMAIFWMAIPSLVFFPVFARLLQGGFELTPALAGSTSVTFLVYLGSLYLAKAMSF
jgi:F0F1-type ATP synthase assembly protein I